MKYDFDTVISRKNTNSLKFDYAERRGKHPDLIPMWVADMDFKVPAEVEEDLVALARHGIFGYSEPGESYYEAVQAWFAKRFSYAPEPREFVKTPGVVYALAAAVRAFTEVGDSVLIQKPVYYPFSEVIIDNRRTLVDNPLVYENGAYSIDFGDFERKIAENNVKMFILCSPHNPVGRVWTKAELEQIGDICLKRGCLVISDEIHCDFVYAPHEHSVFATVNPDFADNCVICTAPSKTFNLAGLQIANIFIKNEKLRRKFIKEIDASGYSQLSIPGLVSCESAYRHGADWLDQLKEYLGRNIALTERFAEKIHVNKTPTEGTYLAWLDFSTLGLSDRELQRLIEEKAGVWLDGGLMFGENGAGFQRVNLACPRSVLEEALSRMEKAVRDV